MHILCDNENLYAKTHIQQNCKIRKIKKIQEDFRLLIEIPKNFCTY